MKGFSFLNFFSYSLLMLSFERAAKSSMVTESDQQGVIDALCHIANSTKLGSIYKYSWKCSSSGPLISYCLWKGIVCSCGVVVQLDLREQNLIGSIPSSIGVLSNLLSLNFMDNSLTGSIPSEIGLLSNLVFIGLGKNSLSGTIPATLNYLSRLNVLELSQNSLSGMIPSSLCSKNLTYLGVSKNSQRLCFPPCLTRIAHANYQGVQKCGMLKFCSRILLIVIIAYVLNFRRAPDNVPCRDAIPIPCTFLQPRAEFVELSHRSTVGSAHAVSYWATINQTV